MTMPHQRAVTDNRYGPWLDKTLDGVPHARAAVLGTMDGIAVAYSQAIDLTDAEKFTAAMCGTVSLAKALATAQTALVGGTDKAWVQSITEYHGGYVLVLSAGSHAYLAATAGREVDLGVLNYALQELVGRLGKQLDSPTRAAAVPAI